VIRWHPTATNRARPLPRWPAYWFHETCHWSSTKQWRQRNCHWEAPEPGRSQPGSHRKKVPHELSPPVSCMLSYGTAWPRQQRFSTVVGPRSARPRLPDDDRVTNAPRLWLASNVSQRSLIHGGMRAARIGAGAGYWTGTPPRSRFLITQFHSLLRKFFSSSVLPLPLYFAVCG